MRHAKACRQCRQGKRECTAVISGQSRQCKQCNDRQQPCSLDVAVPQSLKTLRPASSVVSPRKDTMGSPEAAPHGDGCGLQQPFVSATTRSELVELYLGLLHHKPHTLFHPPTLRRCANDGSLSVAILYAIFGLAARFSSCADTRGMTSALTRYAKHCLKMNIDDVHLDNVQACILVGNLCGADGDAGAEALYFGRDHVHCRTTSMEKG